MACFFSPTAERRVALKAELDRLKAEGPAAQKKSSSKSQDEMGVPASRGSITLQDLRLPLKADFVCSTANRPGTMCFCCWYIKYICHVDVFSFKPH